ncbi:SNF2 family N-terminal domain-containing protein [Hypoxylon sp. NC1633]|nr:SNF2 family N-terminal domain-containing protein [Hypoxylon sp. NC1633]
MSAPNDNTSWPILPPDLDIFGHLAADPRSNTFTTHDGSFTVDPRDVMTTNHNGYLFADPNNSLAAALETQARLFNIAPGTEHGHGVGQLQYPDGDQAHTYHDIAQAGAEDRRKRSFEEIDDSVPDASTTPNKLQKYMPQDILSQQPDWAVVQSQDMGFLQDDDRGFAVSQGHQIKDEDEIKGLFSSIQQDYSQTSEERSLEGFKYSLYKHQQIGLEWMMKMEEDANMKGGILGDDMGLGKTLTTIALIKARPANVSSVKTNLIVAPVSLLRQWAREIDRMLLVDHKITVHTQHDKKLPYDKLCQYDVVLTTYGMLSAELNKKQEYEDKIEESGAVFDHGHLSQLCPLLGNEFYRIVLDEAQNIKNAKTKSAKAASMLRASYRWCLTGTPMQNSTKELGSLIHFLRIKPYCDLELFKKMFSKISPPNQHSVGIPTAQVSSDFNNDPSLQEIHSSGYLTPMMKLQAVVKAIMLRRTKESTLNGKPIIELKGKTELVHNVVFGEDQQEYYRDLQREARVVVNKYLREGTIGKHYAQVLVLVLRLRQACCHPNLHLMDMEYVPSTGEEQPMIALAQALPPDVVERIRETEAVECPICHDMVQNPVIMFPCGDCICPTCVDNIASPSTQEASSGFRCLVCHPEWESKVISHDAFKKAHMPDLEPPQVDGIDDISEVDEDNDEDGSSDDSSEDYSDDEVDEGGSLKDFVVDDDDDEYTGYKSSTKSKDKSETGKSPRKRNKKRIIRPEMIAELRRKAIGSKVHRRRYMRIMRESYLPSAKIDKCMDIISTVQKTTDEKIIIFSQWVMLLDLVEIAVRKQFKIGLLHYNGGMTVSERDDAVREFTNDPEIKIILVSLKSGNAGLNLTVASQVIIMDPFWNPYVENQAIDRTHRIGQQREVTVHRILVPDTVEDRIVDIKERKRAIVDSALSEEASKSIGRLGAAELVELLGIEQ